jgi:hypothetical protein
MFVAGAIVVTLVVVSAGTASAKFLPITDLQVTTRTPVAKSPVRVTLRLSPGSPIGGVAVTHGEVVVLPASRADADGWPVDRTDGKTVVLHRVRDGVFRGTFVVQRNGDYVVLARSSFHAHEDSIKNVQNVPHDLPSPIRVTVRKH